MKLIALLLAATVSLSGDSAIRAQHEDESIPQEALPTRIANKPILRDTYEFVARHQTSMRKIPCFCGCHEQGHQSIVDCFVTRRTAGAAPEWSTHGAACGMCMAIAQNVKRGVDDHIDMRAIEERIRKEYGPSNDQSNR